MVESFNCKSCGAPLPEVYQASACYYCGSNYKIIFKPNANFKKYMPVFIAIAPVIVAPILIRRK